MSRRRQTVRKMSREGARRLRRERERRVPGHLPEGTGWAVPADLAWEPVREPAPRERRPG